MDRIQAEIKIKLWLFESSQGQNLLASVAEHYRVKVNVRTVESIECVRANSYEIMLDCIRDDIKVPIVVFVRFDNDEIIYYSARSLEYETIQGKREPLDFRLRLAELLYTIAFRLVSKESVDTILGYGCILLAYSLCVLLIYCARSH